MNLKKTHLFNFYCLRKVGFPTACVLLSSTQRGQERKTVTKQAKLHRHRLPAMNLVAREGLVLSHLSSHKLLLEIVLAYSCMVLGGGGGGQRVLRSISNQATLRGGLIARSPGHASWAPTSEGPTKPQPYTFF